MDRMDLIVGAAVILYCIVVTYALFRLMHWIDRMEERHPEVVRRGLGLLFGIGVFGAGLIASFELRG